MQHIRDPVPVRTPIDDVSSRQAKVSHAWTVEQSRALQARIDEIFGSIGRSSLRELRFSLTIADPSLPDCPLIGCSDGFCDLTGYDMSCIVGQNCRFLIDPVPQERVDSLTRDIARDFVKAVRENKPYLLPPELRRPYMPMGILSDSGVFCVQTNAKKDGTLFQNMFYLKSAEVDDRCYIIGLQAGVEDDQLEDLQEACNRLSKNMLEVQRILSQEFWCTFSMDRQDECDEDDGFRLDDEFDEPQTLVH